MATELPRSAADRARVFKETISSIRAKRGDESIFALDETGSKHPAIATGITTLDYWVAGIGGFPRGRIVEIFGPESTGKSTLALMAVAAVQREGGSAAYIDVENALDARWMQTLGVNVGKLYVSQPGSAEEAFEIVDDLITPGGTDLVVVDSVAALVPRAEIEGEYGEAHMGLQARLMSQALRRLTGLANRGGTCIIFINQVRQKIGVVYGSPEVTTGGVALKFYASLRLELRAVSKIKEGDEVVGSRVRIRSVKNKMSAPYHDTEVTLNSGGFDLKRDLVDAAIERGIIDKKGSWLSFGGERYQGVNALLSGGNLELLAQKIKEGSGGEK